MLQGLIPSANKASKLVDVNQELQAKLLAFLKAQPAWQARAADHVLVIHHPNSMAAMRSHFRSGMFNKSTAVMVFFNPLLPTSRLQCFGASWAQTVLAH